MTCRELIDFIMAYTAGELAPEQRACFDAHLPECPACVDYLRSYRETVQLARGAVRHPDDPLPVDVPEELVRAVLAARRKA